MARKDARRSGKQPRRDTGRAKKRGADEVAERSESPNGEGSGQQRTALDAETPISRSREKRTIKPIERLGVVPGERPVKERKRRKIGSGIIYIERAGAHSGELKYLIKAGKELIRKIEDKVRGDGVEGEDDDKDEDNGNSS